MKLLPLILLAILILPACGNLAEDSKQSYDNLVNEANEVTEKIQNVTDKAQETAEDIKKAADALQNAKAAIIEIAE